MPRLWTGNFKASMEKLRNLWREARSEVIGGFVVFVVVTLLQFLFARFGPVNIVLALVIAAGFALTLGYHRAAQLAIKWVVRGLTATTLAATAVAYASIGEPWIELKPIAELQANASLVGLVTAMWLVLLHWTNHVKLSRDIAELQQHAVREVFVDHFTGDWRSRWTYEGDWDVRPPGSLVVTGPQQAGGITEAGEEWGDYTLAFQAMVTKANLGVIARARDLDNYYMLQLRPHQIVPHTRRGGHFTAHDTMSRSHNISIEQWHDYEVWVRDRTICLIVDNEVVFENSSWLRFPTGKVGFRCCNRESALIRGVKVTLRS